MPLLPALIALGAIFAQQSTSTQERSLQSVGLRVETAPDWDAVFNLQTGGWTGADGIFSFPLNENEQNTGYKNTGTLFMFSDTFTGDVLPDGSRSNLKIVHNTAAYRPAGDPWAQPVTTIVNRDPGTNTPIDLFPPSVPGASPSDWYWMKDGIILNGRAYMLASWWGVHPLFVRKGIVMIEIPAGEMPPFNNHIQREVPLFVPAVGSTNNILYGGAIMPNTATAGAPHADGFIYIYGHSDASPGDGFNKPVYVARVLEADFSDIAQWRFWDGLTWSTDINDSEKVTDLSSLECSVTPLPDGRYVMVFQRYQSSDWIAIRIADSPVGPWSAPLNIYECPESSIYPGAFPYNAKAHPHLSQAGELLISYNVNTVRNTEQKQFADIYRPRFIRLIAK